MDNVWHMVLPSDLPDSLIYLLLATVYGLVFFYFLSPFLNRQKRTIYDFASGTAVRYQPGGDRHGASKF